MQKFTNFGKTYVSDKDLLFHADTVVVYKCKKAIIQNLEERRDGIGYRKEVAILYTNITSVDME